jgi:hypothetical protein
MDRGVDLDWEPVQSWVLGVLGDGRVAEMVVTVSTLTILGWTLFGLHKAMQNYQILGSTLF